MKKQLIRNKGTKPYCISLPPRVARKTKKEASRIGVSWSRFVAVTLDEAA